jgi:hypothetical protein
VPVLSGGTVLGSAEIRAEEITFTETSGSGVYTGSVTVPAESWLLDIKIWNAAYWTNSGTAAMIVGDGVDPNGWYDAIDLKATDIVPNEVIDFNNPGGQEGAYLVTATGQRSTMYSTLARVVTGEITTSSTGGTAGRTRMLVVYTTTSNPGAATKV